MENINSNKKTARIAGLIFLMLIVTGVFAEFFVRAKIFVFNDPVATAANIQSSEWLYRIGIVSDLIMNTAFFFFPLFLYKIFKQVDKNVASVMVISVMISVAIYSVNMLNQVAALILLSGADFLSAFGPDQLNGLVTFFLKMHTNGYYIAQIFFGLYLLPLGYLIYKSGFMPKIIGVFLMLGFLGDFIDFVKYFLFPDVVSVILDNITVPADLGEFSMCLWLLIMGVDDKKKNVERAEVVEE